MEDNPIYSVLIFLHVAGVFGFLLAHGASAAASFALFRERNLERAKAMLDLSSSTVGLMYASLLTAVLTGVILGILGGFWNKGWIWASLILLVLIWGAMDGLGSRAYAKIRKAVGLPYRTGFKDNPAEPPASAAEIDAVLGSAKPMVLAGMGVVGLLIILGLMYFKPF